MLVGLKEIKSLLQDKALFELKVLIQKENYLICHLEKNPQVIVFAQSPSLHCDEVGSQVKSSLNNCKVINIKQLLQQLNNEPQPSEAALSQLTSAAKECYVPICIALDRNRAAEPAVLGKEGAGGRSCFVGQRVSGKLVSLKHNNLILQLGSGATGRLHKSQLLQP